MSTPPLTVAWRSAEFCVLDLETTGLDRRLDEIVSYGATVVAQARVHNRLSQYGLVRPQRAVSTASTAVHGLHDADLVGAPRIDDVLDDLIALLSDRVLVAHAAWFDAAFLTRALHRRRRRLGRAVVDTARLAAVCGVSVAAGAQESSIEATARRLGVPIHTPHHALGDAMTTAQVFLVLATRLEQREHTPLTVGRLVDLST